MNDQSNVIKLQAFRERIDDGAHNPCLAAALAYARAGLHVFPAPRGHKMSYKAARFSGGTRWGATTDPIQIERDWVRWPDANVCIACGSINGVFVVDVDVKNGVDGRITLAELIDRFGS